jgi:histidyl-tRNA synthetase
MAQIIQKIKGTNDILPSEIHRWHHVEEVIRQTMEEFNYKEIRTPIFERTELFSRGVGETTDIVSKEMYSFTDMGGTSITLRPELTASVVRSFIQNQFTQIAPLHKLWYFGPQFRQERPQKGRYRQFWQVGVEAIGSPNPEIDAEVIMLYYRILEKLGLHKDVILKINSIGDAESREAHKSALKEFLAPRFEELSAISQERFEKNPLRILDSKNPIDQEIVRDAPHIVDYLSPASAEHYQIVLNTLDALGVPWEQDHKLVRGLDYYTHTAFEFTASTLGAQNAICGGGRYDKLVHQLGGGDIPAIGWGSGIERLLLMLEESETQLEAPVVDVFFVALPGTDAASVMKIVMDWRNQGIKVDMDYLRRSMKAQMREANRQNARFVAIMGGDEMEKRVVQLKNLSSGEQEELAWSDVVGKVKIN